MEKTIEKNLAFSCQGCNNYKYNKINGLDSITGEIVDLFNPRKNEWIENFKWSDDVLEMLGITTIGRVTIDELKLNRTELKNLRYLLANAGKHPPK